MQSYIYNCIILTRRHRQSGNKGIKTAGTMLKWQMVMVCFLLTPMRCHTQICRDSTDITRLEEELRNLTDVAMHDVSYLYSMDDTMCNRSSNTTTSILSERAVCPWELDSDIKDNRYPRVLVFARCRCSRCQGDDFECRPIHYRVPVLEKQCVTNTLRYRKSYVAVSVGCICAKLRSRRSKKNAFLEMLRSKLSLPYRNDQFFKNLFPAGRHAGVFSLHNTY